MLVVLGDLRLDDSSIHTRRRRDDPLNSSEHRCPQPSAQSAWVSNLGPRVFFTNKSCAINVVQWGEVPEGFGFCSVLAPGSYTGHVTNAFDVISESYLITGDVADLGDWFAEVQRQKVSEIRP